MADAFQCDRCKGYDTGKPVLRVVTRTTMPPTTDTPYDLCPECLALLHDWLDAERAGHP